MYRVIIADDEPWALYRIQHLVEQAQLGFEVVGTAGDGMTALELVRKERPALLLSDIRMPELDGLALVREVRKASPETLAVMITGFSDFSYAVDALRQGVFDYLVKPIKKENLTEVLSRAKRRLAEQDSPRAHDLYFTLFSGDRTITLRQACELLGVHTTMPNGILATAALKSSVDMPLISVREEAYPAVLFRTGHTKMTVLLPTGDDLSQAGEKIAALLPAAAQYIGMSPVASMDTGFAALLHQSEIAMMTAAARKASTPFVFTETATPDTAVLQSRFTNALMRQDQVGMLAVMEQLRATAEKMQFDELFEMVNAITLQLIEHRYGDYEALDVRYFHQLETDNLMDALLLPIEHAIRHHETRETVAPSQIQRILRHIDQNYSQDLKLTDLSRQFFLSTNYLSIIIKKETGMTFSELIIRKRIARAKELLVQTDTPIQDVMEQAGYRDYSSFIKLFQKHAGCTPYAYRKNAQTDRAVSPSGPMQEE